MTIIDQLIKLGERATPGPWRSHWDDEPKSPEDDAVISAENGELVVGTAYYDGPMTACGKEDAAFIVALVNAWPRLRTVVEAAKAWRDDPMVEPDVGPLLDALKALEEA